VKQEDIEEKKLSNQYVSYTSRKAFDAEKDKPIMAMTGGDLPCKCLTFQQRADDTFKLELDQTKLTKGDAGTHALYITVTDEFSKLFFTKNMYIINLVIEYEEKIVIEESVEY
jgi:hypothetical protein